MKKRLIFFLTLLLNLLFANIGFGDWILSAPVRVDQTVSFKDVGGIIECYRVNGATEENEAYSRFATLEGALKSANAISDVGGKVNMYLKPKSFIDVKNQILTLKAGVSLYLPYEGKTYDISSDDEISSLGGSFVDTSEANVKKYNVSKLNFINTKLTVSSGAQIYIGGKFGEKGVCGVYSEIDLDKRSNITVYGSLYCHGYIKETNSSNADQNERASSDLFFNSFDSERYVRIESNGAFYSPLVFYDAGGLSQLTGLDSKGVFPINVFDFPNIQTYLKILAGATFKGETRLSRTTAGRTFNVRQKLTIVKPNGAKGDSLMTLKSGFISFEYCPIVPGFTSSDSSKTYITIDGETTLGFLEITVNGAKISTSDKFLPFSYKMQLVVGSNGNFITGSYKIKFMGGSLLKVLNGGKVDVQSEVIGYKANSCQGVIDYPDKYGDSSFIINGEISVSKNAKIGGHFKTENVSGTATIDVSNVAQGNLIVSSVEGLTETAVKIYATGDFFDSDTSSMTSNLLKAAMVIKSDSNGMKCWANGGNLLSYVLSVKVDNPNNYENPLVGYKVFKYDKNGSKSQLSTEGVYTMSSGDYLFEKGESFEIDSLERAEKTEFTKQNGTNYIFSNNTMYAITNDIEITITAGEGVIVRFSLDAESGSGGSTVKISESLSKGGNYYQIGQSSSGVAIDVPVKKGAFVKYEVTQGKANGTKLSDHYLFHELLTIKANDENEAQTKSKGQKLTTNIHNKTSIKIPFVGTYVPAGSTSVSTDTLISDSCTIHAYIDKR